MSKKITLGNIKAYIQGNLRYRLFYSKWLSWLLPLHIFEQISYRLFVMNKECYNNGECVKCGCSTPQLQMANKACHGKCYPIMMNRTDWFIYKREYNVEFRYFKKRKDFELRISKTYRQ
jgi:hypothetical protein